jgi:predicted ferric reductase
VPTGASSRTLRFALLPALTAGGAAAVLMLWVSHNNGLAAAGGGEAWVDAGRVTGLEGTYAALLTVLFLSRVPWLDRIAGMPTLAQWHKWAGQAAVTLLVLHTLLTIWGYREQAHATVWHETRYVVLDLPDMLAATVGLAAFVAVSVVSIRAIRRRLRYETWHFIHLYIYLALALSFAHQFATGADFATHLDSRVMWAAMYGVVIGLLVTYRFIVPIVKSIRHDLRVESVVTEANGSTSVYVAGRNLRRLKARPGQFFIWRFLSRSTWWQAHPFSLSSVPTDAGLRITVRSAGDFTDMIERVPVGCRVIAEGPFGVFVPAAGERPTLLVAAGAGIAPIRAMLEDWPARSGDLTLVYRARSPEHIALRDEIDTLASTRGVTVHYLLGPRGNVPDLFDPNVLQGLVPTSLAEHDALVCGPADFSAGVVRALRDAGVPRGRIHTERFRL